MVQRFGIKIFTGIIDEVTFLDCQFLEVIFAEIDFPGTTMSDLKAKSTISLNLHFSEKFPMNYQKGDQLSVIKDSSNFDKLLRDSQLDQNFSVGFTYESNLFSFQSLLTLFQKIFEYCLNFDLKFGILQVFQEFNVFGIIVKLTGLSCYNKI